MSASRATVRLAVALALSLALEGAAEVYAHPGHDGVAPACVGCHAARPVAVLRPAVAVEPPRVARVLGITAASCSGQRRVPGPARGRGPPPERVVVGRT